jgi:glucose-6-phosphate 1-epimerase
MDTPDLSELQQRYGIPGAVSFAASADGLITMTVSNAHGSGSIALQGAQLLTWTPTGQEPVVWLSPKAKFAPGKSARGGVPVCWPWFGPHASEAAFPAHGFARAAPWDVVEAAAREDGSHRLSFRLRRGESDAALWPCATPLEIRYTLGLALEIELITRNDSPEHLSLAEALHTYFAVGDVRDIRIEGLDGTEYIDKVDGGQRKQQAGPVAIAGEVDRVYLGTEADCLIVDPVFKRRVRVEKRGSRSTVVWNPWAEKAAKMGDFVEEGYLGMVCVESANAADDAVALAPGEEHRLWVRYSVEA